MNFKFMNKKIIVSIITVLILLLIAGGVFWWLGNREIKGSPEDYVIKETDQGKIVENKKAGFTAKVPEGWEIKKIEVEEGGEIFHSPDAIIEWRNDSIMLPLKKGCAILTTVIHKKANFQQIEEDAREIHFMLGRKSEEFEKVTISNIPALKNTFETQEWGPSVSIYIPYQRKVYSFHLHWASDEKKKCIQEFEKFLETVSIK